MAKKPEETTSHSEKPTQPKTYPLGVTQSQIDEWKRASVEERKTSDKITLISVAKGKTEADGYYYGYLREMTRQQLGVALQMNKTDSLKAKEFIILNTWLHGDDVIKSEPLLLSSAALGLEDIVELRQVEIKEL